MKRTKAWLFALALLALLALACLFWLRQSRSVGTRVEIYQNNILIESLNLAEDRQLRIARADDADKSNLVVIAQGRVQIQEATCPDQICVKHGPTRYTADPIVCLPNRLELRVVGATLDALDGVTG